LGLPYKLQTLALAEAWSALTCSMVSSSCRVGIRLGRTGLLWAAAQSVRLGNEQEGGILAYCTRSVCHTAHGHDMTMVGAQGPVNSLAFSENGYYLATR
jgi:hypothetical protein